MRYFPVLLSSVLGIAILFATLPAHAQTNPPIIPPPSIAKEVPKKAAVEATASDDSKQIVRKVSYKEPVPTDISIPSTITGDPDDFIMIPATTTGTVVKWYVLDSGLKVFPTSLLKDTKTCIVISRTPGTYRVIAWTCTKDGPTEAALCLVTITGIPVPLPPSPNPPGPNPPGPSPGPAPIPVEGFRVLIVDEASKRSLLPAQQLNALFSKDVRDYLEANCINEPLTKKKGWAHWDKGYDVSSYGKLWVDALTRANSKASVYPWLIISNGRVGYEGPFPQTVEEVLTLLKKYNN